MGVIKKFLVYIKLLLVEPCISRTFSSLKEALWKKKMVSGGHFCGLGISCHWH